MTFPKNFPFNMKANNKDSACPTCKTPFAKNAQWKRDVKTRGRPLLCNNPGCGTIFATLPPRKRTFDHDAKVSKANQAQAEQQTSAKKGKHAISALLNTNDGPVSGLASCEADVPRRFVHIMSNGPNDTVTSHIAHSGAIHSGPGAKKLIDKSITSRISAKDIMDLHDSNSLATSPKLAASVPSSHSGPMSPIVESTASDRLCNGTPATPTLHHVATPTQPGAIGLDAITAAALQSASPLHGNSAHQIGIPAGGFSPFIRGGDQNLSDNSKAIAELLYPEGEMDMEPLDIQDPAVGMDFDDLFQGILGMERTQTSPGAVDPDGIFTSTTGIERVDQGHDPMQGNTYSENRAHQNEERAFQPGLSTFWDL